MMGGDNGPSSSFPAVLTAAKKHPSTTFLLFGKPDTLTAMLEQALDDDPSLKHQLKIKPCAESVLMDDKPAKVLRNKKDSSMRRMIEAVAAGEADACVSAGNTGALFALAYYLLKTHEGIDRPALVSSMPTSGNMRVFLLDLGANVNCTAEVLFQYGVMGSVLASQIANIEKPKVALLNVGEEDIKGNAQVKMANELLKSAKSINYIGYVEGDQLFNNVADVIVTDGFSGNIALKSIEGLAKFLIKEVKQYSRSNLFTRLVVKLSLPLLKKIYNKVNPDQYNGASLIGLRGTVIKSHGNASADAFHYAIERAIQEAEMSVPDKIKKSIETVMLEQL